MFLALLAIRFALDIFYILVVSDVFGYMGFNLVVSPARYAEGLLVFMASAAYVDGSTRRPSDLFILMIALAVLAPLTSMFSLSDIPRLVLYGTASGALMVYAVTRGPTISLPYLQYGRAIGIALCIAFVGAAFAWSIATGGLGNFNLDLTRVYEFREESTETVRSGLFGYLTPWAYKVSNVILFAYALHRRRWILAAAALFAQVVFFGLTAAKATLFYPVLIFFLYFYLRRSSSQVVVPAMLLLVFAVAWIAFYQFDFLLPSSMFVRRVFFVGAANITAYYEFFGTNGFVFWSNSVLSFISSYPYDSSPADLIGQYRGTDSHANNSFFGTGYMHAGVVGVWVYSLFVGFTLKLIDSMAHSDLPIWLILSVVLIPVRSMIGTADFFTGLLTHGVLLALLLLFLLRRPPNA
ncbi:MAG: hypothetical protein WD803_01180 [Gammaproteobacteria bacterium]